MIYVYISYSCYVAISDRILRICKIWSSVCCFQKLDGPLTRKKRTIYVNGEYSKNSETDNSYRIQILHNVLTKLRVCVELLSTYYMRAVLSVWSVNFGARNNLQSCGWPVVELPGFKWNVDASDRSKNRIGLKCSMNDWNCNMTDQVLCRYCDSAPGKVDSTFLGPKNLVPLCSSSLLTLCVIRLQTFRLNNNAGQSSPAIMYYWINKRK